MPAMPNQRPVITLLTDFGERDDYVGAMKGVILSIAPDAQLVDISHQVEPQNIAQAASILDSVYRYYPAATVHVVVVDPGVGSERRPIALHTAQGTFVAPDNGVLTHVYSRAADPDVIALENTKYWLPNPSMTFHGRDIFSPVAAHLATGVALEALGPRLDRLVTLTLPELTVTPANIRGEVIRIDHFGNALTNIMPLHWLDTETVEFAPPGQTAVTIQAARSRINCGWHTVNGLRANYTAVASGQPVALIGSSQELEIAVNQGNASQTFDIKVGSPVTLQFG
jgi:S-adenosylmethionine hydrolase